MDEEIFRKKSLDKMKSPENLNDYIRVSNPSVWLLIVCVIVLLVGACIWGMFGHIDSNVPVTVYIENETAVCYVKEENIVGISVGMVVNFDGNKATVEKIGSKEENGYICTLKGTYSLPDGFYNGNIVIRSYKPLSFILN